MYKVSVESRNLKASRSPCFTSFTRNWQRTNGSPPSVVVARGIHGCRSSAAQGHASSRVVNGSLGRRETRSLATGSKALPPRFSDRTNGPTRLAEPCHLIALTYRSLLPIVNHRRFSYCSGPTSRRPCVASNLLETRRALRTSYFNDPGSNDFFLIYFKYIFLIYFKYINFKKCFLNFDVSMLTLIKISVRDKKRKVRSFIYKYILRDYLNLEHLYSCLYRFQFCNNWSFRSIYW